MPEPASDPSVTDPAASVTQPNEPPAATTDDPVALKAKLELIKKDNLQKGEANVRLNTQLGELQRQFNELQQSLQSGKHKQLEDQGEYKALVAELRETLKQKQTELDTALANAAAAQKTASDLEMKLSAYACISDARPNSPEDLFALLQPALRRNEAGRPVVLNGGVEVPLAQYIADLKKPGSGREYLFQPSRVRGMNITSQEPSGLEAIATEENPYGPKGNLTQRLLLEMQNPDLAAQLRAEAGLG